MEERGDDDDGMGSTHPGLFLNPGYEDKRLVTFSREFK
jgi:hypothetical protein